MIEEKENIDLVTMRRLQDQQQSQATYQQAVSEGRLAVRPRATERAQLEVATSATAPAAGATEVATSAPVPAADPEVAWRYTRLAITAGLVVLLLVVWIWQRKRTGR